VRGWGESKYVKLLYILAEHRIKNTEYSIRNTEYEKTEYNIQELMYIKLPMYLFFLYGAWT